MVANLRRHTGRSGQTCPKGQPGLPRSLSRARFCRADVPGILRGVIHEVDHALRSLIERDAVDGTDVEVVFDAPTKDWAARRTVPTIDVYLYDIREDLRRRERGLLNTYDGDRISSRSLPPRYFKLSYLVTAWTQRPEDEHRLLASLLSCFLRYDALPTELVTGPLADPGLPVALTIALPPPEDRSFADVWSALGGELKPSLDIVVSAPTATGQDYPAAPPILGPASVTMRGIGSWPPEESRRGRPRSDHEVAFGDDSTGPASARARARAERDAGRAGGAVGAVGAAGAAGSAGSARTGLTWHELGEVRPSAPAATSAEGAPPRRRGKGISRKDTAR